MLKISFLEIVAERMKISKNLISETPINFEKYIKLTQRKNYYDIFFLKKTKIGAFYDFPTKIGKKWSKNAKLIRRKFG